MSTPATTRSHAAKKKTTKKPMSASVKNNPVQKQPRTTGYRVESESYPNAGGGCYQGQDIDEDYITACTTTRIVGEFDSMKDAVRAAKQERDRTCQFEDWAEDFYDDKPPPYCSSDNYNPDEDEQVLISIVDIAKENANKENAFSKARSSRPPKKQKKNRERKFGPQKGNFKPDMEIFLRNPCRVAGGEQHLPSEYGNGATGKLSFAYLMQRISDRNYTMRALCLEASGARYTSFSNPRCFQRCIAWLPDSNLNDHATNETILDACHMDLVNPKKGNCFLTSENLLAAANENITCMFLNSYQDSTMKKKADPKVLVKAIQACPNLQCVSLTESVISNEVLQALSQCSDLRGILFSQVQNKTPKATDESMAALLRASKKLKWLYVDESNPQFFGTASWLALGQRACPDLEVLWIDSTTSKEGRHSVAFGDLGVIHSTLSQRASALKLCMVNPDDKLKSRYGGKKNRLNGDKIKIPKYSYEEEYIDDMYADW